MARRAADTEAAADLGNRLTTLHERTEPRPGFDSIAKDLWRFQEVDVSGETIRKMHAGKVDPHGAALEVLLGLARYYGTHPESLGQVAAKRLHGFQVLWGSDLDVSQPPWNDVSPEQGELLTVAA